MLPLLMPRDMILAMLAPLLFESSCLLPLRDDGISRARALARYDTPAYYALHTLQY